MSRSSRTGPGRSSSQAASTTPTSSTSSAAPCASRREPGPGAGDTRSPRPAPSYLPPTPPGDFAMTATRRSLVIGVLALAAFFGALVAVRAATPTASSDQPYSAAAARTSFPGLRPAAAEPSIAGLDQLSPAPGSVVQAPGPFDDRLQLDGLTLD